MPDAPDARPPLSSGAVAKLFNVHTTTVIDWADKGLLPCFRTPGGQRRFRPEDVESFLVPAEDGAA